MPLPNLDKIELQQVAKPASQSPEFTAPDEESGAPSSLEVSLQPWEDDAAQWQEEQNATNAAGDHYPPSADPSNSAHLDTNEVIRAHGSTAGMTIISNSRPDFSPYVNVSSLAPQWPRKLRRRIIESKLRMEEEVDVRSPWIDEDDEIPIDKATNKRDVRTRSKAEVEALLDAGEQAYRELRAQQLVQRLADGGEGPPYVTRSDYFQPSIPLEPNPYSGLPLYIPASPVQQEAISDLLEQARNADKKVQFALPNLLRAALLFEELGDTIAKAVMRLDVDELEAGKLPLWGWSTQQGVLRAVRWLGSDPQRQRLVGHALGARYDLRVARAAGRRAAVRAQVASLYGRLTAWWLTWNPTMTLRNFSVRTRQGRIWINVIFIAIVVLGLFLTYYVAEVKGRELFVRSEAAADLSGLAIMGVMAGIASNVIADIFRVGWSGPP